MAGRHIYLFGAFQMTLAGDPDTTLRSDKARALLAYLAVEHDQAHRRERLAGLLWPDYPESAARANLRRALADLRQAINDQQAARPYFHSTRETIQFNTASDAWVDVNEFAALLKPEPVPQAADPASPDCATDRLAEAVALYRGPFLEGFSVADGPAFEEWMLLTRERLQRQAMQTLARLADWFGEQGKYDRALGFVWRQIELDPWQESAHGQAMQLLALSGQRGAALAQYETCRQILAAELGAAPSPQTQQLFEDLRSGVWPPAGSASAERLRRAPRTVGPSPYRGLSMFREQDAPFFFGRGDFEARLEQAVSELPSLSVVVGASGSGKSSAIFAGLLPRLRREGDWAIFAVRPGARPFDALAAALLPALQPDLSASDLLTGTRQLADMLAQEPGALGDAADRLLQRAAPANALLLVVDQFEELYTLCGEPTMRRQFVDALLATVDAAAARRVAILLGLRADFIGQALAHRPLADALQAGSLMLGPMTRAELHAAIEKPASQQGAAFEPGLVDRILDDIGQEPGNLPLLEFALTLLWEGQERGWLTHRAYERIGRVDGALARYADRIFNGLNDGDQEAARHVFVQLVRPGEGTEDTRRVATRADVGDVNWPLTALLADKRLVVTGSEPVTGEATVEVIHEALIQRWQRLRGWMASDRVFRAWQEGLRIAVRQWQESGRDPATLLRGAPLVTAESWRAERGEQLGEAEHAFIETSCRLRDQQEAEREAQQRREQVSERRVRRLLGALAAVLAVAAVVALALTAFSLNQRRQALQAYSLSLAANAQQALDDQDSAAALTLAVAANEIGNPPATAQRVLLEAAYAPGARRRDTVEALFAGLAGAATALAISPDGGSALAGLADGGLVLWNSDSGDEILRLPGHTGRVNDIAFSPDGATALSGGDDGQAILWDLSTGAEVRRFSGHSGIVRAVDISPDSRLAVSGGFVGSSMMAPGELILWDMTTGEQARWLDGHGAGVVAARFTPDGRALLASSGDAEIFSDKLPGDTLEPGQVVFDMLLWDVATGQVRRRFDLMEDDAFSLAVSPDGVLALSGSFYNAVATLWDLDSGARLQTLAGHHEGVHSVAFDPDGTRALTGSYDDSLILWDLDSGEAVARLTGHNSDVLAMALAADGRSALSSARDGGVITWDLVDGAELQRLAGHDDMVWDVAFTPDDGSRLLSSSGAASPSAPVLDASIRLWDLTSGAQQQMAALPVDVIFQVAISPDGRTALVATTTPIIRVWDIEAWQEVGVLEGHHGPVTGVEFTPDGRRALSVSVDGTLILWDVARQRALHRFDTGGNGLWSLAISPDGRTALSDSGDSSMILWDLETGELVRRFVRRDPAEESGSTCAVFLPDGHSTLSCEQDGYLIVWDLATGEELRRFGPHASLRTRAVVSQDGKTAVTSGMDGALMTWNLETGELVRRSDGHGVMFDLALSPDGQSVIAGSSDTTITRWQVSNPSLDELRDWIDANRAMPDLSCEQRERYLIEPLCDVSLPAPPQSGD